MNLERFCVKFFARPSTNIDDTIFIEVFQEWIRLQKLDNVLIDIADYRHVPQGPGIMLLSHEVNYALDYAEGQFGLFAQRKVGSGETASERLWELLRSVVTFGQTLETDPRVAGKFSLEGGRFQVMANDRLLAPNTAEAFEAWKPELAWVASKLYPNQEVSITRLENDPRARLTAVVNANRSVALRTLANRVKTWPGFGGL